MWSSRGRSRRRSCCPRTGARPAAPAHHGCAEVLRSGGFRKYSTSFESNGCSAIPRTPPPISIAIATGTSNSHLHTDPRATANRNVGLTGASVSILDEHQSWRSSKRDCWGWVTTARMGRTDVIGNLEMLGASAHNWIVGCVVRPGYDWIVACTGRHQFTLTTDQSRCAAGPDRGYTRPVRAEAARLLRFSSTAPGFCPYHRPEAGRERVKGHCFGYWQFVFPLLGTNGRKAPGCRLPVVRCRLDLSDPLL